MRNPAGGRGVAELAGFGRPAHSTATAPKTQDRVLLCELWQRRSAKGNTYLSGYLGKARLVAFKRETDLPDGVEAVWEVCVTPGKERGR